MDRSKTFPLWDRWDTVPNFPQLEQHTAVDVAIIGGGITGITTALLLGQRGFKVCVLEAGQIGFPKGGAPFL
ncbi:MAG TPA: FAD-dependent oxidoreductase [Arenibacter sp.]|nr:FAD-dependent oxidoreductase [Arenibacter sp.]